MTFASSVLWQLGAGRVIMSVMRKDDPQPLPDTVLDFFRKAGAVGGKRGGKARWKGISAAERSAQMRAVRAAATKKSK